jgi:uncharacterized protein YdbL (DUF1318 family)
VDRWETGAQVEQVGEHLATFVFELEAYPEAKTLSLAELRSLHAKTASFQKVADLVGASEAFVRHTIQQKNYARD